MGFDWPGRAITGESGGVICEASLAPPSPPSDRQNALQRHKTAVNLFKPRFDGFLIRRNEVSAVGRRGRLTHRTQKLAPKIGDRTKGNALPLFGAYFWAYHVGEGGAQTRTRKPYQPEPKRKTGFPIGEGDRQRKYATLAHPLKKPAPINAPPTR